MIKLIKINIYVQILILSSIVGIVAIESNSEYYMNPDSTGYHNMAIDILETGSHTNYFREPGFPYFLAGCYKIFSVFGGNPTRLYPDEYDIATKKMKVYKSEIHFAKYIQLFLLILSIMIFYSSIKYFFSTSISKLTVLLCSIYYPFIVSSVYLLREPFLVFLITLSSYFLSQYFIRKKISFLLIASCIIGIGALTFQVVIAFYVVIFIAVFKNNNELKTILVSVFLTFIVLMITIAPWCYQVYNYYPDIRIVKTIGSSLTYQGISYVLALRNANEEGILSDKELSELQQKNWYTLSDHDLFERSFNGWYISQSDSLNKLTSTPILEKSRKKIVQLVKYFSRILIHKNYSPLSSSYELTNSEKIIKIILQMFSYIVAFMTVFGIILLPKSKLIYFMPQMMFVFLFFVLGSESRRFLPAVPFTLFLSSYFTIIYLVPKVKKMIV